MAGEVRKLVLKMPEISKKVMESVRLPEGDQGKLQRITRIALITLSDDLLIYIHVFILRCHMGRLW